MNEDEAPDELQKFRILSLDGGGVRGYLSIAYLREVEKFLNGVTERNVPLGQRFDLICGTSTGAIIALALATGRTAAEIFELYETLIPDVFDRRHRRSQLTQLFRPRYRNLALKNRLEAFFGKSNLAHVLSDVCVTGVSLNTGKPRFYKSDYFTRNAGREEEPLANIALGATAAPTYFEAPVLETTYCMVDGGVCCNNPAIVAITDAMQFQRNSKRGADKPQRLQDIAMLSVGTGQQAQLPFAQSRCIEKLPFVKKVSPFRRMATAGIWSWGKNFHELAITSQSLLVHFQATFLLKDGAYHRFDPPLGTTMPLDAADRFKELDNLGNIDRGFEIFARKHLT